MHIDRIHDLDKKKFENDVMHKLQNIVHNLEPPKPEISKPVPQAVEPIQQKPEPAEQQKPVPYRVLLRLPATDPAAPAEALTRALRAANLPFEVETIERVRQGDGR